MGSRVCVSENPLTLREQPIISIAIRAGLRPTSELSPFSIAVTPEVNPPSSLLPERDPSSTFSTLLHNLQAFCAALEGSLHHRGRIGLASMPADQISYSEKYYDDVYEYR